MIVPGREHEWGEVWGTIEDEMQISTEKGLTIIFSVHEVETVCAVKMLQVALRTKGIQFSQYPVENEASLQQTLQQLLTDSTEFRTVLLLNCGASKYVKDLAPADCSNARYIIIDSHRPIHPRYNDTTDVDVLLMLAEDDPTTLVGGVPPACALDDMTEQQRQQLMQEAQDEQDAEDERREEEGDMQDSPAKRQRRDGEDPHKARNELRLLREREKQLHNYYELGSSYGKPTPLVLLPLAELLLAKTDNSLLWPAAVALTDQWVHQRLSAQHYESWYRQLADAVAAADANFAAQQQQQQQHRHGRSSERLSEGGSGKQPVSQPRLVAAKDYRLMLFRHWTLFDAFCYSPYVAPRLQTWRPGGKEAVALLFANMGVSIEQAKTDYSSMQGRFRELFSRQLEKALLKTSLSYRELAGDGFQLQHSLKVTAASDVVHACTALLSEYCVSDLQDQGSSSLGFWKALEALDCHTQSGWLKLLKGIQDAKILQQAIIMDGGNMVTDQKLKVNPSARLQELNLVALAPTNAAEFRHPLTLLRLAHFVRDATKIARQGGGLRAYNYPIMVIGPEDAASWCIVIGLRSTLLANNAQFNIFGRTFQAVLEGEDSEVQWDLSRKGFDASVVYIHRDSLVTFCSDVRAQLISNAADAAAADAANTQSRQQQGTAAAGGSQPADDDGGTQQQQRRQQQQRDGGQAAAAGAGAGDDDEGLFSDVESLAASTEGGGGDDGSGQMEEDVVEGSEEEEEEGGVDVGGGGGDDQGDQ